MARITLRHRTRAQVIAGQAGTDISDSSHGRNFQIRLSDPGAGSVTLQNDDPSIAGINYQDYIQFLYDGVPRFQMKVENIRTATRAPGEEHDQTTTFSGRSSVADWDQGVIYPPNKVFGQPFTDTRVFGYSSKELSITGWPSAVQVYQQGTDPPLFPPDGWFGAPHGWPDPDGWFIWSRSIAGGVPLGSSYFAKDVTIPARGRYAGYIAGDNAYKLWINGVMVAQFDQGSAPDGYQLPMRFEQEIHAGTCRIAIEGTNYDEFADMSNSIAGVIFVLYAIDEGGNETTMITRTDNTWKCQDYPTMPTGVGTATRPTPPGFTVGRVLRLALEEAQVDENTVKDWTLSCTDTHDSAGREWSTNQTYTFSVGSTTLLQALQQLAGTDIDYLIDPNDFVVHVYKIATPWDGDEATATLRRLSSLTYDGQGGLTPNTLLIRWKYGYAEVRDDDSIAIYGRQKGFLSFPDVETKSEAERLGHRELKRLSMPSEQIDTEADPDPIDPDDALFTGWNVGDYILTFGKLAIDETDVFVDENGNIVLDGEGNEIGTLSEYRVREVSVVENDDGEVQIVPSLSSRHDEFNIYLQRTLNRYLKLNGDVSPAASLIVARNTVVAARPRMVDQTFSWSNVPSLNRSPPWTPPLQGRLTHVFLERNPDPDTGAIPGGSVSVNIYMNNSLIGSITIPGGQLNAIKFFSLPFGPTNTLSLQCTTTLTTGFGMTARMTQVTYMSED